MFVSHFYDNAGCNYPIRVLTNWCISTHNVTGNTVMYSTSECTVKPVLRDHSRDRKMWSLNTGELKTKVHFGV